MFSVLIAILIVDGVRGSINYQKFWIHNTNFQNPRNWNLNRVPCEQDRVMFPPELELGVTLPPGKTILSELVLATNGELFLPADGVLQIGGGDSSKCRGADIKYIRSGAKAWLDPNNWRPALDKEFPAVMPHIDRIPCEDDDVVFQDSASFRIQLPPRPVTVRNIQFGAKTMSNLDWQQWLGSEAGFRQFIGSEDSRLTAVAIQQPNVDRCNSKLGCDCIVADPQKILNSVCSYAKSQCKVPSCYYPVTPLGHCCPSCGSYLTVKYDKAFDITTLRTLVNDYVEQEEYAVVLAYAKKTSFEPNTVQIVLINGEEYQENTKKLADILALDILKDMELGATKVLVYSAGPAVLGSKLAQAVKTIFSTFFVVALFICTIFYVFVYRQGNLFGSGNYRLFQFARFENTTSDDETALALAIDDTDLPTAASPSKSFDNPMYGATESMKPRSDVQEDPTTVVQEKAVYSELKKRAESGKIEEVEETEEEVGILTGDMFGEDTFHEISFDK